MNDGDDPYLLKSRGGKFMPKFAIEWPEIDLTIKPLSCVDFPSNINCYASLEYPILHNKRGGFMKFPIYKSLTVENIIIDSIDSQAIH